MRLTPTRAFLVPVIFLAVGELLCRTAFSGDFSGRFDYGYAPEAGFRVDGDTLRLERTGGRRFYPQQIPLKPQPGRLRLFTLGDSITRGGSLETAYPALLAQDLAARGVAADSLNLGLTAYGAARKLVLARQVLNYSPDVVLLHVNEANEGYDQRDWERRQFARSWHPANWPLKSYLIHRLYEWRTDRLFWRWLAEPIRTLRSVRTPDAALSAAMKDPAMLARWHESATTRTAETVRLLREAGVPVVLIVVTVHEAGTDHLRDFGLDAFARGLAGPGVEVVSTTELFAHENSAEIFSDGLHYEARGHQLLAARLAEAVLKLRKPA